MTIDIESKREIMKKVAMLITGLWMMGPVFAQTDVEKRAVTQFQQDFNAAAYEAMYRHFSPQMQQALPVSMLKTVSEDIKKQLGSIQNIEFIENKGKATAIYKVRFEKDHLKLSLSLNDQQQMTGLLFSPYIESEAASNTTENHIQSYPKDIAEKIFAATRTFPENTQVAIAVLDSKKTQYLGVHKYDNKIHEKANQDQVFAIGSISKVFTATILAELVSQKKIGLEDSINRYYPFQFKDNIQLKFKDLSNHTSGLERLPTNLASDDATNPYKDYDAAKLHAYLQNDLVLNEVQLSSRAPTYSNLGVGLLGHTLALAQKTTLENLYQQYIFSRYGMKNTFVNQEQAGKHLVPALDVTGKEIPTWDFDVLLGAGGVLSTVEDMSRFAQAQLDAKNSALQMTQQPSTVKVGHYQMGMGWFIRESENGQKVLWHGGNTAGHTSILLLDLNKKKAVTILANVSAVHPEMGNIEQLAAELLK